MFIPKKIFIFLKTQKNIEIRKFDPKKMDRAYVCMKISEYPPWGGGGATLADTFYIGLGHLGHFLIWSFCVWGGSFMGILDKCTEWDFCGGEGGYAIISNTLGACLICLLLLCSKKQQLDARTVPMLQEELSNNPSSGI